MGRPGYPEDMREFRQQFAPNAACLEYKERTRLSGLIEADETHIGGPAKGKTGRGVAAATHKTLVAGAVEVLTYKDEAGRPRERAGRVRLRRSRARVRRA